MGDTASTVAATQALAGAGQAYSQYAAGAYTSKVDLYNAKIASIQAADATRRGETAVNQHQAATQQLLGRQRASFAGQGVIVDSGSAADVTADTLKQSGIDDRQIRANAALEAWGYQAQATDERARAKMASAAADNEAAGTLLRTSGRFADSYDQGKNGGSGKKQYNL